MRLRDNALRVHAERALRVTALIVLAFAAWRAAQPEAEPDGEQAEQANLHDALVRWTSVPPGRAHVTLERAPPAAERDWMRALRRAGTPLTWDGRDIPPLAVEAAFAADPRGGATIWVVAPEQQRVLVADAISVVDTVVAYHGGAMVQTPIAVGPFTARIGDHVASTALRDTTMPRRVLVIGRATWDAKFIIMALEEAGWGIDARLALAPGVEVTQGNPGPPDTARHAVVIVLDPPVPAAATAVARYVRSGGGLILAGESADARTLMTLASGQPGARVRPASATFVEDAPRRALAFRPIAARRDALVLEEQGDRLVIAARRVESGRVIQVGYLDTWRWRFGGGAHAVDAHRDWWSGLLAAAAYRASVPLEVVVPDDPAPLASLVAALGAPATGGVAGSSGAPWAPSPPLLFSLILGLVLAEIASRRLRGAP